MTRFLLIRHGETDWNRDGRWQGHADVPLNQSGVEQAARLAQELNGSIRLAAIYSSDLLRARQTAEPLATVMGLPVYLDPRLREIDQGEWQGLSVTEIKARYSRLLHQRSKDPWGVSPPGGETALQVQKRAAAVLAEIATRYPDNSVAVVTHGYVLAVILAVAASEPVEHLWQLAPNNCSPVILEAPGGTQPLASTWPNSWAGIP